MKVQPQVLKFLNSRGIYNFKTMVSNRRGVPDIIACYGGYLLGLEIKEDGDSLSTLQARELEKIKNAGGKALEVRSLQQVVDLIEEIEKEKHEPCTK